jgi:predicted transcriptional regulator
MKQGNNMAGSIAEATRLHAQLEMAPIDGGDENKLTKLRESNGWGFARGSKRGRLEVMAEILFYCTQQKTKTDIMYKVNLNYVQLKKHLAALTFQGLLTINKNKFATTQKGCRFLELFFQLNAMLKS